MKDRLVQMLKEGNFVGSGESVLGKAKYVEALQDMPFVKLLSEPVCVVASEKMKNARISGCLHVTPQTSVLINALASILGVQLRWSACNMESTSDDIAQFMVENGFAVFAKRNETIEEYWLCIASSLMFEDINGGFVGPTSLVDDGGDATLFLIEGIYHNDIEMMSRIDSLAFVNPGAFETKIRRAVISAVIEIAPLFFTNLLKDFRGVTEETTTGIVRANILAQSGILPFPVVNVNGSAVKSKFDNLYGSRESVIDAIQRSTRVMLGGKVVVVLGYGSVGKGVASAFRAQGCRVIVTEIDPICALQALMEGYEVLQLSQVLPFGDIFITTTGCKDVIIADHIHFMKDGAILANAGHFNSEIAVEVMDKEFERVEVMSGIVDYFIEDRFGKKKRVRVLAEGRLVNLVNAEGHPSMVMSCSMAVQLLGQMTLYADIRRQGMIFGLSTLLDEQVARVHVSFLGGNLTVLTDEQADYLGVPVCGPYKNEYYRY